MKREPAKFIGQGGISDKDQAAYEKLQAFCERLNIPTPSRSFYLNKTSCLNALPIEHRGSTK